ncbi:MAG: cation:proton antiporter, partial [Cyanobacteria bacterium P01_A01_bin.70]
MRWVYVAAAIALYIQMLVFPNPAIDTAELPMVELVVEDSGVANAVSGIIFRNR